MTTAITKFQLGAAALAVAGAAAISPVVAQADSMAPLAPSLTSFAKGLGSAAGQAVCDVASGVDCAALAAAPGAAATAGDTFLQNNFLWIGDPNPVFWNSPDTIEVWTFSPLNLFPFLKGTAIESWWNSQSTQSCFIGITTTLGGPYAEAGQYKHAYNRSGCNGQW